MNTFRKSERLCSKKELERLFSEGHGFVCFPYSVRWIEAGQSENVIQTEPVRVVVSTSKRRFRRAVDRNRVKRLTRECYRLHKQHLYEMLAAHSAPPLSLSLSYIDTHLPEYQSVYLKFDAIVARLVKEIVDAKNL